MTSSPSRTSDPLAGDRSVVVTGIGLATGLGLGREATWAAMKAGRTAVRILDRPELARFGRVAGCPLPLVTPVEGSDCPPEWLDPIHVLLERVTDEAVHDSGLLAAAPVDRSRVGVVVGLSKGGIRSLSRLRDRLGHPGEDPAQLAALWLRSLPGAGASLVADRLGLCGPSLAPVAACATGVVAVLQGADLIRRGLCDVVLAGSVDASLEPIVLAAFQRMKILARFDGDPASAVRPWDRRRSGFVVGEGGAILVLEAARHAAGRGALPYVELAGGALGGDAYHATDLDPDPTGIGRLIGRALEHSSVLPAEIDHVNVHGTATRVNDPLECGALRLALGEHAGRVACTANKSQIGHLLGAAGAAELAMACLAIRDQFVPPTLNLTDPDPACDLDGTPLVGRALPVRAALKLSIGFGGHIAAAVLRRPAGARRPSAGEQPWATR